MSFQLLLRQLHVLPCPSPRQVVPLQATKNRTITESEDTVNSNEARRLRFPREPHLPSGGVAARPSGPTEDGFHRVRCLYWPSREVPGGKFGRRQFKVRQAFSLTGQPGKADVQGRQAPSQIHEHVINIPELPRIAVTMGDPAGIGPELCLRLLQDADVAGQATPIVFGDAGVLRRVARHCGLPEPAWSSSHIAWRQNGRQLRQPAALDLRAIAADKSGPAWSMRRRAERRIDTSKPPFPPPCPAWWPP